jgi:hypothetical protein
MPSESFEPEPAAAGVNSAAPFASLAFKPELHVTVAFVGGSRKLRPAAEAALAAAPPAVEFEVTGLYRETRGRLHAAALAVQVEGDEGDEADEAGEAAALFARAAKLPHVTLHVEPPLKAAQSAHACALQPVDAGGAEARFERVPLASQTDKRIVVRAELYAHRCYRKGEQPLVSFTAAEGRAHAASHADCPILWWGYLLDETARTLLLQELCGAISDEKPD